MPERWEAGIKALGNYNELVFQIYKAPSYVRHIAKRTGLEFVPPKPQLEGKYEFMLKGYQDAKKVHIGGTFNNWEDWKTPLEKTEEGWVCRIDIEADKYEYKFRIDGKWIFDPENAIRETNCEGRTNSIIVIK